MLSRVKLWSALAAIVAVGAGGLAVALPAGAAISNGPYFDIGCSQRFNVLVYTETNVSGAPTGAVAALPWACGNEPDLQQYVRVNRDATFGNIIVKVYRNRNTSGMPLGFDVVRG